jgi:hypothetical protein
MTPSFRTLPSPPPKKKKTLTHAGDKLEENAALKWWF